ncbi:P-loop NTPase fold protein [Pelosinus sp. UFO1]|uniref:KAP family P-loop NTPase fold protein n=1 Tax=Pelosinus sp. UFO1 TaxID=484770 RepID=UPI0004D190C9|nr:P-loop NTPase fold protein [Pelosinus sp. UFO1]AIF51163.1 KAP P-loop domain protein [Pelosinus sp. UFO1]
MPDNILKLFKSNRHEILTEDNDYLNTIPKGKMIKNFIEKISGHTAAQVQMIALYGDWGSGKTSLMRWIEKDLCKERFYPVFFEAWKHENDENLALSMVDVISVNKETELKEVANEVFSALKGILKGVAKSITLEVPGAKINLEKIVQEAENYLKPDDITFYKKIDNFQIAYKKMENSILGNGEKKLLIFIDDLDRCEPENVLALLSAIKLFFTFGQRTIFMCGLDKEAVNKAVQHKYGQVLKSDEYLEKIFDISFSMPKEIYLRRFLETYLISENKRVIEGVNTIEGKEKEYKTSNLVSDFFETIKFGNSRQLRKILNKYIFIKYLKEQDIGNNDLIPNLNQSFYVILTLFIIILYEFHPDYYNIIKNYDNKLIHYSNTMNSDIDNNIENVKFYLLSTAIQTIKEMKCEKQVPRGKDLNKLSSDEQKNFEIFRYSFLTIFAPLSKKYLILNYSYPNAYMNQFTEQDNILSRFCMFIEKNIDCVLECNDEYILSDIFAMAELYL